jgi:glycosyltransferase involved in cell wall biosynthesis
MRIALITDAWSPQVNGVVRTLTRTVKLLEEQGHELLLITPELFRTFPMPTYPEIPVSFLPGRKVKRLLDEFQPEAIHIATEGTIGWAARRYCLRRKLPYTSAYHTRYPEYVRMRVPIPLAWSYAVVRRFHNSAVRTMVATPSMQRELEEKGFRHLVRWSRGVDIERFKPQSKETLTGERPAFVYLGRVAVEKNIEAFLELKLPGQKYVIGDGPAMADLKWRFPDVEFLGYLQNQALVDALAAADVMVFPSRTDTFGLVMLEAMACGVPVWPPTPRPGRSMLSRTGVMAGLTKTSAPPLLTRWKWVGNPAAVSPRKTPGTPAPASFCTTCAPSPADPLLRTGTLRKKKRPLSNLREIRCHPQRP